MIQATTGLTRHIRQNLFFAFGLLASGILHAAPLVVREESVSPGDINTLPPVCRLILVEDQYVHLRGGDGPLERDIPLLERAEYRMALGNPHLHHYCWALISKQRYFRAQGAQKRKFYFDLFMGDIGYVMSKSRSDWPYFNVLLDEQSSMLLLRGEHAQSLAKAEEALRRKPGDEIAYTLLFDNYMALGNKKKAIESAQEGLKDNPASHRLRRRLTAQGITLPPIPTPPPEESAPASAPEASSSPALPQDNKEPAASEGFAVQPAPPPSDGMKTNAPAESESTKPNPYCRFCP